MAFKFRNFPTIPRWPIAAQKASYSPHFECFTMSIVRLHVVQVRATRRIRPVTSHALRLSSPDPVAGLPQLTRKRITGVLARINGLLAGLRSSHAHPQGYEASQPSMCHHQNTPAKGLLSLWPIAMSKGHKSILDPFIPASLLPISPPLATPRPTTMTTRNTIFSLPATTSTPERRSPARGANSVAASAVEDGLQALKAYYSGPFGEAKQPIRSPQKRAMHSGGSTPPNVVPVSGMIPLFEHPIYCMAHVLLTTESSPEEVELCWPLSKDMEGPPGQDLTDFKQFHHQVWKMFESAEDLMTDEYLEVGSTQSSP